MVILRVGVLLSAICPLLSASCLKVSLFFASNFKVDFYNATKSDTKSLGRIFCFLSQSFAFFASSFKVDF